MQPHTNQIPVANRWCHVDTRDPNQYEAYVTTYGLAEAIERAAILWVPSLQSYMKAAIADDSVGTNGIGSTRPLVLGERVIVSFVAGDASQPQIIQRSSGIYGLTSTFSEAGSPIAQPGQKVSGYSVNVSPIAVVPEAIKWLGLIEVTVKPIGIVNE